MPSNFIPERIETDRLRLDRLDKAVAVHPFHEYAGRTETIEEETKYAMWTPHSHLKESADVCDRFAEQWDAAVSANYAVFPRPEEPRAGEFAGTTGLSLDWETRAGELGIWLRKPFWGRGYSGERAAALVALAFDRLDLDVVTVWTAIANDKATRAIEKYVDRLGGRQDGTLRNFVVNDNAEPVDVHHYSISQAEWREAVGDEHGVEFTDELAAE
jgi:RimJ/RimL family protein N-acetyltransferase